MIIRTDRLWLIVLLFCMLMMFCPDVFARHFDLKLARLAQIPPNVYYMVIEGSFTIDGKASDPNDEIGIFVQTDNSIWKLCGVNFPTGGKTTYTANIFSYLCVDSKPNDGIDKVPVDGSVLQLRLWDNSKGVEKVLDKSQIKIISPEIKNSSGDFIYKKNNFIPGMKKSDPWKLDIIISMK